MDEQNFNNNYQDNTADIIYQAPVEDEGPHKANGMQITSLVLGICSIVLGCCFTWLGIILGILAIIFSVIGGKAGKHGIGTAGLVCGIIGLALGVIGLILAAIMAPYIARVYGELFSEMGYYNY